MGDLGDRVYVEKSSITISESLIASEATKSSRKEGFRCAKNQVLGAGLQYSKWKKRRDTHLGTH